MHPAGVAVGARAAGARRHVDLGEGTLDKVIGRSKCLTSRQRLQIYGNAYIWRLVDILFEEYPTLVYVLGERRFGDLAREYIAANPSTSYSLNHLSAKLPEFVRREAKPMPHRGFCAAVARVERTMEEVFDAEDAKPLSLRAIERMPAEKWAGARFRLIPAHALLELDWPVNEFMAAVRDGMRPEVPRKAAERLVLYRKDYRVWRAPLTPEQWELLGALREGRTLTEAFEACSRLPGFDAEAFTANLRTWFQRWAAERLFARVEA